MNRDLKKKRRKPHTKAVSRVNRKRRQDSLPIIFMIAVATIIVTAGLSIRALADNESDQNIVVTFTENGNSEILTPFPTEYEITYGTTGFSNSAVTTEVDGGAISYESEDTDVATISNTGAITVVSAGQTQISITAAAVPGVYNETSVSYNLIVNPKDVTLSGVSIVPKEYDGNTSADIASGVQLSGVLPADSAYVDFIPGEFVFVDRHAGNTKPTTRITDFALTEGSSGDRSSNYTLVQPSGIFGIISPKGLTIISGVSTTGKAYDGNTDAALTVSADVISTFKANPEDVISISGTGTYSDKNVGTGKTVSFTAGDFTITGASHGDYTIADVTQAGCTADITAIPVTVSGITAENKVFDNNTDATLVYSNATISGKVTGDDLSVSATGTFSDKNIGAGKTVTISGLTLGGSDAGNYTFAASGQQTTATASITGGTVTPVLTLSPTATYTYTGYAITPQYTVTVNGETFATANYEVELCNNINAGTATISIKQISDADRRVYSFSTVSDTFTIGKATLTAANISIAPLTYTGSAQNATVSIRFGTSTHSLSDYNITGETSGTEADSYIIHVAPKSTNANVTDTVSGQAYSVNKTYAISPKPITVSGISAREKEYDGTNEATLDYSRASLSGVVSSDSVSVKSAKGTFVSKNAGHNIQVEISRVVLKGDDAGNYVLNEAGSTLTTSADITRMNVTPSVSISPTSYKYTGSAITPKTITVSANGERLEANNDYRVEVTDNNAPGTGHVTISCTDNGNYIFDPVTKDFTISQMTSHTSKPTPKLTASATAKTVGDVPLGVTGWSWENPSEELPAAGKTLKATAIYTGADAANYTDSCNSMSVTITVPKDSKATKTSTGTRSTTGTTGTRSSSSGTASRSTGTTSKSGSSTSSRSSSGSTSSRTSGSSGTRTSSGTGSRSSSGSAAGVSAGVSNEAQPPFVEGAPDVSGWDTIIEKLVSTAVGDSVPIYMNGSNVVPADLFNSIKGKSITAVFDMGNSIKWTVNGTFVGPDISSDIDYSISTNTNNISDELVNMIAGSDYTMQLSLAHEGEFGCSPILTLNLGSNNAGLYANLFYHNKDDNSLEYVTSDDIDENGYASLTFSHASDYVIIVDGSILANETAHIDIVEPEENFETADASADIPEGNEIASIADDTQAYVQTKPMDENAAPKRPAIARRIVAPEMKSGVKAFWIILLLVSFLAAGCVFFFMNREALSAGVSSRRASRALKNTGNTATKPKSSKSSKKYKKYL